MLFDPEFGIVYYSTVLLILVSSTLLEATKLYLHIFGYLLWKANKGSQFIWKKNMFGHEILYLWKLLLLKTTSLFGTMKQMMNCLVFFWAIYSGCKHVTLFSSISSQLQYFLGWLQSHCYKNIKKMLHSDVSVSKNQ